MNVFPEPKKKVDELITKFPLEPLINAALLSPKKNDGVSTETLLPLTFMFPFEPLMKLAGFPIKNVGVETETLLPLILIFPFEPLI